MRGMFRHLILAACLLAGVAHAAPSSNATDDIEKFLADRGVISHMEQLRQRMSQQASELVVNAMGFLGVPYRRGGNTADSGFDCSGFVRAMYEQTVGLVLPRRARDQAAATETIERKDLQPGDLVFFNTMRTKFSHVGIYLGDNKFIHSPKPGEQVRIDDMRQAYWDRRFNGARRVKDAGTDKAVN
jgi:cell wall-associated NlpC family hydrolase